MSLLDIFGLRNFFLTESGGDGVGKRILADAHSEYEQLRRENVATILSYGDNFMDMVCRDACDGHEVGRVSWILSVVFHFAIASPSSFDKYFCSLKIV